MKNSMTKMSKLTLYLIPIAIAVNFIGGQLAILLKVPLFLDTIGTIFLGIFCGFIPAVIAAVVSLAINAITLPTVFAYVVVGIWIAFASSILARKGMFSSFPKCILSAIIIAIVDTIIAVPITVIFFGGYVGTGASLIVATLMGFGWSVTAASVVSELASELSDKIVSVIVIYALIKALPDRFLIKLPFGKDFVSKNQVNGKADLGA